MAARDHGVSQAAGAAQDSTRTEKENRAPGKEMNETTTDNRRPVAYKNEAFLGSPDARILRILSEYLEPLGHFRHQRIRDTIVFFGSARLHEDGPLGQY